MHPANQGRARKLWLTPVLIACAAFSAHAADTYDPASRVLNLPSVSTAGSTYTGVSATVGAYTLLGVDGGQF